MTDKQRSRGARLKAIVASAVVAGSSIIAGGGYRAAILSASVAWFAVFVVERRGRHQADQKASP